MKEIITSVGIDIGTSTTQLIFSRLTVENRASSYAVPRIDIVDKEVFYRSGIYITPLTSPTRIDAEAVKAIVKEEYRRAGMTPKDLQTGAVIITGETARKQNANQVLEALSSMAGDFVVATAGPDLESVLSARGAGVDRISEEERLMAANLDVGGGTTNIGAYFKGDLRGTSCLDVGGRLVKISEGKITYIFPKLQAFGKACGIEIREGEPACVGKLSELCELMASQIAQAAGLLPRDEHHLGLYTNGGRPLSLEREIEAVTFSGGVADFVYDPASEDWFRFGDIGPLLGRALSEHPAFKKVSIHRALETIRATVVGAGTHTTEVSGSTIAYSRGELPVKNIPVLKVLESDETALDTFHNSLRQQMPLFMPDGKPEQIAIAFTGQGRTGFSDVQQLAEVIIKSAKEVIESEYPLIVVVEADVGKVLGNALQVKLGQGKAVICIDGIRTLPGDYIDIGEPIAGGHVVPVVIKTLIFNS